MISPHTVEAKRRPPSRGGWIAKLVLLAVSSLLACILVEVGLRIRQKRSVFIFQSHPSYLYTFRPGAVSSHPLAAEDGGGTVPVVINREGRRGPALDPKRPKIVVYGDSSIAAEYCTWENTFTAVLESALSQQGRTYQVVNSGVTGYGPDQELLRMRAELRSLAPDLIVVALTEWNDLGDLLRNKLFGLDDQGGLVERHPVLSPELCTLFDANDPATPSLILHYAGRAANRLTGGSRDVAPSLDAPAPPVVAGFLEQYLPVRLGEFTDYQRPGPPVARNLFADTLDSDAILDPDSESARYKFRLLEAVLRQMTSVCASNHVELVFVLVPSPVEVYPAGDGSGIAVRHPNYRPGGLSAGYAQVLQRIRAPHVRLFDVFGAQPKDQMFLPKDGHWSPAGQKLAAESVARWINEKSLLPKQGRAGSP